MNKAKLANNKVLPFLLLALLFSSCSSAPRRPTEVFVIRNTAENQLNLANHNAAQGRFLDALVILESAWQLALATDYPPLRINTTISRGNILFALDHRAEAFSAWESAAAEAEASALPALAARARLYAIRGHLSLLSDTGVAYAQALRAQVLAEIAAFRRGEELSLASGYLTLALAEKHLHRWAEAEAAARRALAIYERGRFLEDTAYSWFIIASIRSLSGNYDSALRALRTAIEIDRRAENGFGLASSWHAMGDVYRNAGRLQESRAAHQRAADIYRAIGHHDRAEELERQY